MARPKKNAENPQEENNEMTATTEKIETAETAETDPLKIAEVKQQVDFLNLVTGEMEKLTIVYSTYKVNEKADPHAVSKALTKLVTPLSEQNKALAAYAQAQSYQSGKANALARGQYLSPEIKRGIQNYLEQSGRFSDLTRAQMFDRWLDGFQGGDEKKKASATTVLTRVTEAADVVGELQITAMGAVEIYRSHNLKPLVTFRRVA